MSIGTEYATGTPEVFSGNSAAEQVYAEMAAIEGTRLSLFHEVVAVTPLLDLGQQVPGYTFRVKHEGAQDEGSYKIRGTTNRIQAAQETGGEIKQIVVASTGNHAIQTAAAARALGIPTVEARCPRSTVATKTERMEQSGLKLDTGYDTLGEALASAEEAGKEHGVLFVHPFDDPAVIAGQGTVGLEAVSQLESEGIDPHDPHNEITLVVPGGGGGLAAGNVVAMAARYPNVRVAVAQMEGGDGIVQALQGNSVDPDKFDYACDGAAVPEPGKLALDILGDPRFQATVSTVTKAQIGEAMNLLCQYHELPEPAGAEAMALALQLARTETAGPGDGKQRILIPVTTGINTTPAKAAEFRRAAFAEASRAHLNRAVYGVAEVALRGQTGQSPRLRVLSSPAARS